jgi:general secretion pathway protein H
LTAPGKTSRRGGFSLLELILVIAVLSMLAAVVIPSLPGALESARLRGCAGEVRATLTLARTLAVSESRGRSVSFDLDSGEYGVDGDARKWLLPDGILLAAVRLGDAAAERGVVRIRFRPDGSADEAQIAISSSGGGTIRVDVDPLTGMVSEGS